MAEWPGTPENTKKENWPGAAESAPKQQAAAAPSSVPAVSPGATPSSLLEQVGVGGYKAAAGLAGLPGDIGAYMKSSGFSDPLTNPLGMLPGTKDIQGGIEKFTGKPPVASNISEEYAQTFGEFIPAAVGGEGTLIARIGRVLMPAAFAETAKQGAKQLGLSEPTQEIFKFAGSITPASLSLLWRTAPDRMEAAMNQLHDLSSQAYKSPEVTGLKIKMPVVQSEAFRIADDLFNNHGMRAGPTAEAINELIFPPSPPSQALKPSNVPKLGRAHVDYDDISKVRNRLAAIAGNFADENEQRLAKIAIRSIDDWTATRLSQGDLVAGNAAAAAGKLKQARSDWWAYKSMQELSTAIYKGVMQAGASYSGQNFENAVRQRIASIVKSEKEHPTGQFTPREIELMEKSARPGGGEQLARRVARLLPRHGAMATLTGTVVGSAAGHPVEGAAIGAMIGQGASMLENKLANRTIRQIQEEILSRSASKVQPPIHRNDLLTPGVLGRPQNEDQTFKFDSSGNKVQ